MLSLDKAAHTAERGSGHQKNLPAAHTPAPLRLFHTKLNQETIETVSISSTHFVMLLGRAAVGPEAEQTKAFQEEGPCLSEK